MDIRRFSRTSSSEKLSGSSAKGFAAVIPDGKGNKGKDCGITGGDPRDQRASKLTPTHSVNEIRQVINKKEGKTSANHFEVCVS